MTKKNTHHLKIKSQYFSAVFKGLKTFEIRYNDQKYEVGDQIILQEVDRLGSYTGKEIIAVITYLTDYEQKENFVVFSFKKINEKENSFEETEKTYSKNKRSSIEKTLKSL